MVKLFSRKGREFYLFICRCVGYLPSDISLYQLAFVHKSAYSDVGKAYNVDKGHNERLEFLGDAILGAVVAEILYKKFPTHNEGLLTKIRAALVSRKSLNALSLNLGFAEYIVSDSTVIETRISHIHGDVLEAFVAAIYLDGGIKRVRKFVGKYIANDANIKSVLEDDVESRNYKSKIIEWGHKQHCEIVFDTHYVDGCSGEFVSYLKINDVIIAEGYGMQKKTAEQEASRIALEKSESWQNATLPVDEKSSSNEML